jgi:hypothetical protein
MRVHIACNLLLAFITLSPGIAQSQSSAQSTTTSTVDRLASHVNLGSVLIVQEFVGDGDVGQCNGGAYGTIYSWAANWSPGIRIDTDNRSGGCLYRIGIADLGGALQAAGFGLNMVFIADGDAGQCGGQGSHQVPINPSLSGFQMTTPIRMDMRSGGCRQTWSVTGSKVAFDLTFYGDGDVGQCGNTGSHSAPPDITIRLDTDNRPGGCVQSMRLRAVGKSFEEASQASAASNIFDAWQSVGR